MGLDDVFRKPPEWDTDSESETPPPNQDSSQAGLARSYSFPTLALDAIAEDVQEYTPKIRLPFACNDCGSSTDKSDPDTEEEEDDNEETRPYSLPDHGIFQPSIKRTFEQIRPKQFVDSKKRRASSEVWESSKTVLKEKEWGERDFELHKSRSSPNLASTKPHPRRHDSSTFQELAHRHMMKKVEDTNDQETPVGELPPRPNRRTRRQRQGGAVQNGRTFPTQGRGRRRAFVRGRRLSFSQEGSVGSRRHDSFIQARGQQVDVRNGDQNPMHANAISDAEYAEAQRALANEMQRLYSIGEDPESVLHQPPFLRESRESTLIKGSDTIDLSVIPIAGTNEHSEQLRANAQVGRTLSREDSSGALNLAPRRLIDAENGFSVVLTNDDQFSGDDSSMVASARSMHPMSEDDPSFFQNRGHSLGDKIKNGQVRDFQANDEVGILGGAWRGALKRLLVFSYDDVNALQLTRQIQLFMPFLTGYESYVLGQIIEAFESGRKKDLRYTLTVAFQNRNVSRILVQIVGPRYDFVWHWNTMLTWNRPFDAFGQVPLIGFTSFPATENFPNTRNHALASAFRVLLGKGNWVTRVVTGRESLITDDPRATAQNLAAESNGFEVANRNQYGTYVGRRKTNEFRFLHRLPTDESIVRTFIAQPMPTMVNNGVVHVLRQLAKHWHYTLNVQNFAHQRMEQLNPFEMLRFHIPNVLLTLSSLRGRNAWDASVLGPLTKRLQTLKPSISTESARYLVHELLESVVVNVSGGAMSIIAPFRSLLNSIRKALELIENEAKKVFEIVSSVGIGIRLGHDLITQVSWKIPSDSTLKAALLNHIQGLDTGDVTERRTRTAMELITPRDKRTLIELVKKDLASSQPAQLLLGRAKTLLQRELRRDVLNETIRELSRGQVVTEPKKDEWYWLLFENTHDTGVYVFDEANGSMGYRSCRFVHIDTRTEKQANLADGSVVCRAYVPVGESISRAQRAYMNIELDHGKKFSLDAFMEFTFLRDKLRKLIVIAQMTCEELDMARLNLLKEVQLSNQTHIDLRDIKPGRTYYTYDPKEDKYVPFYRKKTATRYDPQWRTLLGKNVVKSPPQSMIVIGGGPTGLTTVIHCTEAVLASGGEMKLYEARDAFTQGSATYERAQIVRLDARWIAMLRYHLGTGFEDVFIPASGETDSQLGNTLPTQGFVEITIKDLENMLHVEVSKMWSKGLVSVYTGSKATYDHVKNSLQKEGRHIKVGDVIFRDIDKEGRQTENWETPWKVVELVEPKPLKPTDAVIGEEYGIFTGGQVVKHTLVGVDLRSHMYIFSPVDDPTGELNATARSWPTIYPSSVYGHRNVESVVLQCKKPQSTGGYLQETKPFGHVAMKTFTLDVGNTHVVEAIGKPHGSQVHFQVTTSEPYGVCCAQGLKISLGMHNFGERRWKVGIVDDIRSPTDQNTRIIGDFTKMCRLAPVAERMHAYMTDKNDTNWQTHFEMLVKQSEFPELDEHDPIIPKIQNACAQFASDAQGFKRTTIQTRFFETGDNYYLGMEFTREYDEWKNKLASDLVSPLTRNKNSSETKGMIKALRGKLMHNIDRLWYEGVLEVIRTGDVYNPGARHRVPRLYMINSYTDAKVGSFPVGESFRLSDCPQEKYEILIKRPTTVVVRNVEGYISSMPRSTLVKREGNLTRSPDGNSESRVALATFPVAHYVNYRSVRLNNAETGYVFAFVGDEQATPHFMRYSGLTGACINAMLFNNFIKETMNGVSFISRMQEYVQETDWSNGEVVTRGTGNNFGEDGFLRPGFSYESLVEFLHTKVTEYQESELDLDGILSLSWKNKIAAALVPRGMEFNEAFIVALQGQLFKQVYFKFIDEARHDKRIVQKQGMIQALRTQGRLAAKKGGASATDETSFWNQVLDGLNTSDRTRNILSQHVFVATKLNLYSRQVIGRARQGYRDNLRTSSELFNQPKSVDSIVDDFAVEAQNFATSLSQSAAFASGTLAFKLIGETVSAAFSQILTVLNIGISFGTMTNSARYKIRNEEARIVFADEQMSDVLKSVYALMTRDQQRAIILRENPFVVCLDRKIAVVLKNLQYYGFDEPHEFLSDVQTLKNRIFDGAEVLHFMHLLATKYIVNTYHVNSYVQESLVDVYRTLDEMHRLHLPSARPTVQSERDSDEAWDLFRRLHIFQSELEGTLQRGATRWGFVKNRKLIQWDCFVLFKYFYSLLCCSSRLCTIRTAPISAKTLSIVRHAKYVSKIHGSKVLHREIQHLETLHWATRESDVASLVFLSAFLVLIASTVFTVAFSFRIAVLLEVSFWLILLSAIGAILGAFHLWRKLLLLLKLVSTLNFKIRTVPADYRSNIRKIRNVTLAQTFLTLTRLLSSAGAAVALPWSVANKAFREDIYEETQIPFLIALGSVCAAVFSTVFFFIVEYRVRYNLPLTLGEFVCESFRDEIQELYTKFSLPLNDMDTKQVQERETWEYVAREWLHTYRFDAVFEADRFTSIWLYLTGGMKRAYQ